MRRHSHTLASVPTVSAILLVSASAAAAQERPDVEARDATGVAISVAAASVPGDAAILPEPLQLQDELVAVTRDAVWSAPWLHREVGVPMHVGNVASFAGADPSDARRSAALPWESIRIRTDAGGVAVGDLLQLFRERRSLPAVGSVYEPTGVARVTGVSGQTVTADLVALYGLARLGDLARPVPAYDLEAGDRATQVEVSQEAGLIGFAAAGNVHSYAGVAFLDRGVRDGVRVGDEFVVMAPEDLVRGGGTQARLQVVAVAPDHTSARIVDLNSPVFDIDSRVLLDRSIR